MEQPSGDCFKDMSYILCELSKGTFEIPHKISFPYIERYKINTLLKIYELSDLRAHIADLVQDCSNSIANAMELVLSCTKS